MPIFRDDVDRSVFVARASEYKQVCGARVYHWVLMGNHYHMLVEVPHANLRRFASGVQQAYAQYHHRRHGTTGRFWQGRFISKPVEIGAYLVACGRYIERNPARAGLVAEPWAYRWSSALHYVSGSPDGLTDSNIHLGPFTPDGRKCYADALLSGADEQMILDSERRRVVGSEEFANRLEDSGGRPARRRGRPAKSV